MKQLKSYFFLLLASALLAACATDEQLQDPGEGGPRILTFTASAPQTRTVLQPGDGQGYHPVYWSDGDNIAVIIKYDTGLGSKGTFTTSIPEGTAPTAVFTGQSPDLGNIYFAAFYPNEAITGTPNNKWKIPFFLLAEQTATPGSFAPRTNPAYAPPVAEGGNLEFNNIGALVKFRLASTMVEDLNQVILRVEGNDKWLTGNAFYDAQNDEIVFDVENYYIPYNWAALKGTFESDTDYYLVVHPFTLTSTDQLSLTFVKADGSRTTKTVTNRELKLEAGHIANLGTIDLSGATFEHIIDNMELIAAVEYNNSITWTKNEDGTVTVTPDNQSEIVDVTNLPNLWEFNVTDLSGIEYFTGLQHLDFAVSNVPAADISKLTKLQTLYCYGCYLTSLDIRNLDNLTTLKCGSQLTGTLTLTLTAEQKEKWNNTWKLAENNENVELVVKEKGE